MLDVCDGAIVRMSGIWLQYQFPKNMSWRVKRRNNKEEGNIGSSDIGYGLNSCVMVVQYAMTMEQHSCCGGGTNVVVIAV